MGKHSVLAATIFMALDGMWLLDSMRLCAMEHAERMALKAFLLKLADV
jgi:hypothetical protein